MRALCGKPQSPLHIFCRLPLTPCACNLPFRAGTWQESASDTLRFCCRWRLQIPAMCPPSSLIGWGQGFAPPPHYLSATAMSSAYHRTSNVHRGLRGLRPPHPRCCALCVPLRARLRPRRYRLRNDARALSRLVSLLHPRKSP